MSEKNLYKDRMHDLTSRAQQEHLKEFLGKLEAKKEGKPYKSGWISNFFFACFWATFFAVPMALVWFLASLL